MDDERPSIIAENAILRWQRDEALIAAREWRLRAYLGTATVLVMALLSFILVIWGR